MERQQRQARIAGWCYLVVAILGGFAHLYVRARVYVPGDAATTAANVAAEAGLVRVGFLADLIQAAVFLIVGLILSSLLKPAGPAAARALFAFVTVAVAVISLNLIHQFVGVLVATDPAYAGSASLVLLMFDLQHYGYLIAQVFFGLWLAPLGYLAYRSRRFPAALGLLLIAGCVGYLIDTVLQFMVPESPPILSTIVVLPAAISEFWMVGYLLVKGIRTPAADRPVAVTT